MARKDSGKRDSGKRTSRTSTRHGTRRTRKTQAGAATGADAAAAGATPAANDPQATARLADPLVGRTIGGCYITSILGRGSMGAVYKANQLSLEREVAIKTIRDGLLDEQELFARFRQEARTVSRFNTPHVVQIHEVGHDQGIHFIIMEFAGGGNLQDYSLRQPDGRLSPSDTIRFMGQCAMGLSEAEHLRIVHRDIKPENLLLDHNNRLKITDFGIAKILNSNVAMTMDSTILGTPLYMSPEQAQSQALNHRSDIYSLGATFFHLLTGKPPIEGKTAYEIIHSKIQAECLSPAKAAPDVMLPPRLNALIEKMTARDPADRHSSFNELAADLTKILEGGQGRTGRTRRRRSRGGLGNIAAALLVVASLGLAAFFALGGHKKFTLADLRALFGGADAVAERPSTGVEPVPSPTPAPGGTTPGKPGIPSTTGSRTGDPKDDSSALGGVTDEPPANTPPDVDEPPRDVPPESPPAVDRSTATDADRIAKLGASRERLEALEARFPSGPDADFVREAEAIVAELVAADVPDDEGLLDDARDVARDGRVALDVQAKLRVLDAAGAEFVAPFDGLDDYRRALLDALAIPDRYREAATPELSRWLDATREARLELLRERLEKSVRELGEDARAVAEDFAKQRVPIDAIRHTLEVLEASRENLRRVLPGPAHPVLRRLGKAIAGIRDLISTRSRLQGRVATLVETVDSVASSLDALDRSTLLTGELEARATSTLDSARKELRKLTPSLPPGDVGTARGRIDAAQKLLDGRVASRALLGEIHERLAARRLADAITKIEEADALRVRDVDLERLAAGARALARAFDHLDALNLSSMARELEEAADRLEPFEDYALWARQAAERVAELRRTVEDMAPVEGGEVRVFRSTELVEVAPFFMDRTETTVAEYVAWSDWQRESKFSEVSGIWPSEEAFERHRRPPPYLQEGGHVDSSWPIEEVNYFQASAYLASKGKALPTVEEWWLAAKGAGPDGRPLHRFPIEPRRIHRSPVEPTRAARGGASRLDHGGPIHHLAGNVAEWTERRKPTSRVALLIGGRYLDDRERYFTGELRDAMPLDDTRRGYGFRGVVRPRDAFDGLLPRD